jgi:hypothetical protein
MLQRVFLYKKFSPSKYYHTMNARQVPGKGILFEILTETNAI